MEILENYYLWILLVITIIFIYAYKIITKNPDAITAKFITVKEIDENINNIDVLLVNALKNSGFKNVGLDKDEKRIYANVKFSMSSFSEFIEIYYNHENSSTIINFKSVCALPTQIYDWGKNKRNYKRFNKELEKLLRSRFYQNRDFDKNVISA